MRKIVYICIGIVMLAGCTVPSDDSTRTNVEIKDNWYYINGEKFFIKGIGYEIGARPGQNPYEDTIVDIARMRYDLKIIKDAGYNTIRTWSQLSEYQLQVVQESGLKIIFGIWIDPHGDFGDSLLIESSQELVEKVVAYSKKYDCVISYLILNEPLTEHIHECGAPALGNLLTNLKGILDIEHPGIPVSISGSAPNADFIDMTRMDYNAQNCYDYGSYQNGTMGFAGFLKWCNELNGNKNPLVITEFGYSVSDMGGGNYGYGGNTLEQQKNGVIKNYREILDAGATGACPFYYADGWWKGGNDSIHNNAPEEWFGFFGYSDLNDTIGTPRPAWFALIDYMKGLVIFPKNQGVYGEVIPLEFFLDKEVGKIEVKLNDSVLYSKQVIKEGYLADSVRYEPKGIEDAELVFEFFDRSGKVLKSETIITLLSKKPVELPKLLIDVDPTDDLNNAKVIKMKIILSDMGNFKIASDLRYNFNFHIGWEIGPEGNIKVSANENAKEITLMQSVGIPDNSWVAVPSAGITVKYGKYLLRLHDQDMIFRGNWADEIMVKQW
ncbi:MAG: hypothetical protein PF517_18260 [Salinivirgaceae bacterium]|jgi:exo-beta-1,3-glucanase (GH17 family)|nr:hypothetical protein [Salinivirgaceae bacterium]